VGNGHLGSEGETNEQCNYEITEYFCVSSGRLANPSIAMKTKSRWMVMAHCEIWFRRNEELYGHLGKLWDQF
jgi:hypothetical protein